MLVWRGQGLQGALRTGGRYDPVFDSWSPTSTTDAPEPRYLHTALWADGFVVIWGGLDGAAMSSGGRYALGQLVDRDDDGHLCDADCDDGDPSVYPGALQACDAKNNDCLHPAWPELSGTNETDDDGDGSSECSGDCNDEDAASWGTPGEVLSLSLVHDGVMGVTTLEWVEPATGGQASAMLYDTIRSGSAADFVAGAVCIESDEGPDTTAQDLDTPAAGSAFHFLVAAQNTCPGGRGPLGTNFSGSPRTGRECP
mgnify:CR=1 FL=1